MKINPTWKADPFEPTLVGRGGGEVSMKSYHRSSLECPLELEVIVPSVPPKVKQTILVVGLLRLWKLESIFKNQNFDFFCNCQLHNMLKISCVRNFKYFWLVNKKKFKLNPLLAQLLYYQYFLKKSSN